MYNGTVGLILSKTNRYAKYATVWGLIARSHTRQAIILSKLANMHSNDRQLLTAVTGFSETCKKRLAVSNGKLRRGGHLP